jgi:DNA repair exonuclease SbcCD ATPase subunit
VAEVLKGLTEFRSVVLVSHDERLVDSFDSVITVVRDETGSHLEAA